MKRAAATTVALIGAVGLGIGATQLASADETTPTPTPSVTQTSTTATPSAKPTFKLDKRHDDVSKQDLRVLKASAGEVAKRLGMPEDQLKAAVMKVAMTQQPTEAEKAKVKQMTPKQRQAWHQKQRDAAVTALAEELGVPRAKLVSVVNQVTAEQTTKHEARIKAELAKAVKAGKLTQAEADAVLKALKQGVLGRR